jgi:hypothetical protein
MPETITLVEVLHGKDGAVSIEDLEYWRKVFEEASSDPNFKVTVHPAIVISTINVNQYK